MFKLPELSYKYDSLEPFIDAATMEIHHSKHHQTYTNNLNDALSKHPELEEKTIEELLSSQSNIPEDIRVAVVNNGGGFYNHSLFWTYMTPEKTRPSEKLEKKLIDTFGSMESFKELLIKTAATRFGSGWAWLVLDKTDNLKVYSTANQDSPLQMGDRPLLNVDVWEHAYYLKYQNRRPEYLQNWWSVINWATVSETLDKSLL
ncbi:superoxide dismutase [candidate division WWE3 bacterium]|uniref:Superoxide dismutase n=1 Tax=candidate division WWE3 bacterium TaxID=2053526 RepID=A0A7X9HH17_UNCKA|nr:superoxide dismutase [candidate division WWE3 bacterium]